MISLRRAACISILGACVVAPTASAQASVGPTGATGRATDAAHDAPAGFDLASLRASVDVQRHTGIATVEMHGAPLPQHTYISVGFGTRAADGTCTVEESQAPPMGLNPMVLSNRRGLRSWSSRPFGGDQRTGPLPRPTLSTAVTDVPSSVLRANCAQASVSNVDGSVLDTTPVATLRPTRQAVPPTSSTARTAIRLQDYDYTNVLRVRDGRAEVSVLCLTSSHRRCTGKLVLRQAGTYRALGTQRVSVPLGRSSIVRVPLNAYARALARKKADVVVRLRSSDGVNAFAKLELGR